MKTNNEATQKDEHARTMSQFQQLKEHYVLSAEEVAKFAKHKISAKTLNNFLALREQIYKLTNEDRYSLKFTLKSEERVIEYCERFAEFLDSCEKLADFKACNAMSKHSITRGSAIVLTAKQMSEAFELDAEALYKQFNSKNRTQKQSASFVAKMNVLELDSVSASVKTVYHARSHDSLRRRMSAASYTSTLSAAIHKAVNAKALIYFDRSTKRFEVAKIKTSDEATKLAEKIASQNKHLYAAKTA